MGSITLFNVFINPEQIVHSIFAVFFTDHEVHYVGWIQVLLVPSVLAVDLRWGPSCVVQSLRSGSSMVMGHVVIVSPSLTLSPGIE